MLIIHYLIALLFISNSNQSIGFENVLLTQKSGLFQNIFAFQEKQSKIDDVDNGQLIFNLKITKQEVRNVIREEFTNLFILVDDKTLSPQYLIGDVNGDKISDLVAVVRVRDIAKKGDLTKPTFWLGKPLGTGMNGKAYNNRDTFVIGDLVRYKSDLALIVIHGSSKSNTSSKPKFNYKYALVDALDNGVNKLQLSQQKLRASSLPNQYESQLPPKLIGMAVLLTVDGSGTAVYWDSERYRWYPID